MSDLPHVAPPSFEKLRLVSYASDSGPTPAAFVNHPAARVPSESTAIDGTSASLTNQFVPRAIVFGADQPCGPRTENFRTLPFGVSGSIQLRKTRPSPATAMFGWPLPAAAGDFSSLTVGAGAAARTTAQRTANMAIKV